jgi:hypothetical protein
MSPVLKKAVGEINATKIIVGAVAVFAGYQLLRRTGLFGKTPAQERKEKAESGDIAKEVEDLAKKAIRPTYSDVMYSNAANIIYNALRYSAIADDYSGAENTIYRYVYNDADFLKLVAAYGKRMLTPFGVPVGAEIGLSETLVDQMFQSRVDRINQTLKTRGLTYKF